MTGIAFDSGGIEKRWAEAQGLYSLYSALARECVIDVPAFEELERGTDNPTEEMLHAAGQWFTELDERIEVHQLRHFLQTTSMATTQALRALLQHHLRKSERSQSDRNKVDFLLVQLFSLDAPQDLANHELDLGYVARVLEPVLGTFNLTVPEWLAQLDELAKQAENCRNLKQLFTSRIIEQGRQLKELSEENFFLPIAMVSFTRYGFLLRRMFFRYMQQDINAILDGLRELEGRGVESLDCRKAQFSAYEPLARLRMICQSWKVMFHAEYSAGQPLCLLVDLRTVVDTALAKTAARSQTEGNSSQAGRSLAVAAGATDVAERPPTDVFDASARESSQLSAGRPAGQDDGSDDKTAPR